MSHLDVPRLPWRTRGFIESIVSIVAICSIFNLPAGWALANETVGDSTTSITDASSWEVGFSRYLALLDRGIERDLIGLLAERENGRALEARVATLQSFRRAVADRGQNFLHRYRVLFMGAPARTELRRQFTAELANDEAGFVKALDAGLEVLREMGEWRTAERPSELTWQSLEHRLQISIANLQRPGELISNPVVKDLNLVMPTGRSRLVVPFRYFTDTVLSGHELFEHMRRLPDHTFSRADSHEPLRYVGYDLSQAPRDAIFVLAFSHDFAMFDVMMAGRVAEMLGDRSPGLLTVERSWPHYSMGRTRETNIVFIEDGEPLQRLRAVALDRSSTTQAGRRVVSIAPEGQVPYFHARFPPVTKPGAFVLARRIANEASTAAQGSRPVYLLPVFSNAMEHLASLRGSPLTVTIGQPVRVPDAALGRPDEWVESARRQFEETALRHRGLQMVDLGVRSLVPGSRVPIATPRQPALRGVRCESLFSPIISPHL